MNDELQSAEIYADETNIDELRNRLVKGWGGEEADLFEANDSLADEGTVAEFISMFGADGDTPLKGHEWKAYVPGNLCSDAGFWGPIFGIIREESESIYIFDAKRFENDEYLIGYIDNGSYISKNSMNSFRYKRYRTGQVIGTYEDGALVLKIRLLGSYITNKTETLNRQHNTSNSLHVDCDGTGVLLEDAFSVNSLERNLLDVRVKPYDAVTNLFSRNTGLLESSAMLDKRAVLVGCGSVGAFAAMQLARSGVGKFVLCDTDILEIHNICRHQCGFDDLGRYKVDAVRDKILNINPNAEVVTYRSMIQRVPEDELLPLLGRNTIIIGGGDNRSSSDWACKLAIKTDSTFVSACCWTRAFAGEIFYWASGRKLSCYSCALGGLIDNERPESHATYFGSDDEKESLSFEPGIAADIDFVTIIAVKLALDLLNRDNENYTPRVINYLKQYTWVCNTNSPRIGGERAGIFPAPLWITNNLSVNRDVNCLFCGDNK